MLTMLFVVLCLVTALAVFLTGLWSDDPRSPLEVVHRFGRFGVSAAIALIGAFSAQRHYEIRIERDWPMLLLALALLAVYGPQAVFERRQARERDSQP